MSRAGLKQLVFCDAGTLSAAPANPIAIGLRNAATMERTPYKEVKDYLDRSLRNMQNFKIDAESLQPTMHMLDKMIDWTNLNCDAQAITVPQSAGGNGDVYKFIGANKAGLDFEYTITADKRSLKATLEAAMEFNRAKTFVDGADSDTPVAFAGITGSGADFTKYRAPYFLTFESPVATSIFSAADLIERSYSIKTKNKKSIYNTSIVDYLTFAFSITARDASVVKQIEAMSKDMSPSILVKEQNAAGLYDAFDFNAGVLVLQDNYKDADDERSLKLTFSGDVPIYDVSFLFATAIAAENGADLGDLIGITGGTMKIGY